ncbi:MAG: 50S ribosomal protein L13 [Thermoguttaceae bacterium]|nr:50S ribosomal protein L13 [Thermoguttaceae bacterium]MBR5758516.1 50S ribosomal protein L13 [Thermoguttaceae bacterium]
MAKPGEVEQKWYLVDATDKVVGRLASDIAMILMGKHRPTYTPHVDTGDYVVVTNVDKVVFTGRKWENKRYTWTTGYTRLRSESAAERMAKHPEMILREAVRRMLPKNKLAVKMLGKLKLYTSDQQHPHFAQQPEVIELGVKK